MTDLEPTLISESDYERFFKEAIDTTRILPGGTLGEGEQAEQNPAARLLEELQAKHNETAEFSRELFVMRLQQKDFTDLGLEVPEKIRKLMLDNRFYLVRIPITIVPKPGNLFWRLYCVVEMNPETASPRPTAVSVYPNEEWQSIIEANVNAEIGVDESLEFKAELDPTAAQAGPLGGQAEAGVGGLLAGGLNVTVGKFHYHVQRPKILARGKLTTKIRWTLDGKEPFKREDLNLGLVMQVPKTVEEVNLSGALLAYRDFETLMAEMKDIWGRIKGYLSPNSREFFDTGAPLPDNYNWSNITRDL